MNTLVKFIVICFLVVAAVYGCVRAIYQNIHVRYRLTVEVKDSDQIKTGSSVIDVSYDIYPDKFIDLGGPSSFRRVTGYAVTVDLGEKGLLFLTFIDAQRTPEQRRKRFPCPLTDIACLPLAAYSKPGQDIGSNFSEQKAALDELLRQSGPRDVSFSDLPRLIRFRDINDVNTIMTVSPLDLSASFGPGVQLGRVTLELTGSTVTPEPQIWPHWLKSPEARESMGGILRGYEK